MKALERYIVQNVQLKKSIEYKFIIARVISHTAKILEYIESTVIRQSPVFHDVLEEEVEEILGNLLILAMHYTSGTQYNAALQNLFIYKVNPPEELPVNSLMAAANNICYTASEMLNIMGDTNDSTTYLGQLSLEAIAQVYSLCEIAGIDINEIRDTIYEDRSIILRSTTTIIKEKQKEELAGITVINIITKNGIYAKLETINDIKESKFYNSNDLVKDFFECTRDLRKNKTIYRYSNTLLEYFLSTTQIAQAYISNGKLSLQEELMDSPDLDKYNDNSEAFEKDYHHILIKPGMKTMDDLLDYLYPKNQ